MEKHIFRRRIQEKRNMLLKVHKDPIGSSHTITQKVTNEKAIARKLKTEGIDKRNILILNEDDHKLEKGGMKCGLFRLIKNESQL